MFENLLANLKVREVNAASVAGTAAVESDVVDMAGFVTCLFVTDIGTANAGNHIKVQQGDESDLSDAADLEGSKVIAAEDGDVVAVEVFRPLKRYVRAVVTRTASTTAGTIFAILGGAAKKVVDNNVDDIIVSEIKISPDEGTA